MKRKRWSVSKRDWDSGTVYLISPRGKEWSFHNDYEPDLNEIRKEANRLLREVKP